MLLTEDKGPTLIKLHVSVRDR